MIFSRYDLRKLSKGEDVVATLSRAEKQRRRPNHARWDINTLEEDRR